MALKTESTEIETSEGTKTFEVTQLTAIRSVRMLTRIGNLLGPALKEMKGAAPDLAQPDALKMLGAAAIGDLLSRLNENDVEKLLRDLFETVTVEGAPVKSQLDMLFAGNVAGMFKLAAFCLQVNFGDFFSALGGLVKQAKPASALTKSNT